MGIRTVRGAVVFLAALIGLAGYIRLLTALMDTESYNTWGALFIVPIVAGLNLFLISVVCRDKESWVGRIVVLGYLLKLVGTFARYFMAYVLYGGASDAQRYNLYAAEHYFEWRKGSFLWEAGEKAGTQAMELITTAVYFVIGPSTLAAFFVFGSTAFWGVYLVFRAFQIGVPEGDHRRYALIVFLLPSLLFWPSSIGKESWLMLFVGVSAYGAARFFGGRTLTGVLLIVLGLAGSALIRPHVTVLIAAALLVAQLFRPTGGAASGLLSKVVGIGLMGVAVLVLTTQSAEFLGIDDINVDTVTAEIEYRGGNTEQGGSAFEPVPLDHPLGIPAAIGTVLFRPLPWEASGPAMLAQSLESVLLIGTFAFSLPRLRSLPGLLRRNPYVVFALVYALAFIIAFAGFSNFGILARQRVLMLPFVLILLALPLPPRRKRAHSRMPQRRPAYARIR